MSKRVAIVGTAPSWQDTPWHDTTLEIWSLNDAYLCRDARGQGFQRIDRWFELHPLDKLYYRKPEQRVVFAEDVPPGHYVRPTGHIDWLKQQAKTIPVYLQQTPPDGWPPNARRFPIEEVKARFGEYWASGPSYMVALAILEGFTEIHIYGIHLATQHEYIEQRPQFEHLLGVAQGLGIRIVMSEKSPLLRHKWQYGYQPKPQAVIHPAHAQAQKAHAERAKLLKQIAELPWWQSKAPLVDRMRRLKALEEDAQIQLQHAAISSLTVRAA